MNSRVTNLPIPEPPVFSLNIENRERLIAPFGSGHEDLTKGTYEGERITHTYYFPNTKDKRIILANTMLRALISRDGDKDHASIITKLITAVVCLFPGEKDGIGSTMCTVTPSMIPPEYDRYLETAQPTTRTVIVTPATADVAEVTRVETIIPDDVCGVKIADEQFDDRELYILLAVGIYAVVKEVNDDNITAFTERRKDAAMRQLRLGASSELNRPGNWWNKESLEDIHSAFNVYVSARISLMSEICRWSTAPVGDVRAWVWGQVKLLRGHGMVPMEAMASFVNACYHIVEPHAVLREEALAFLTAKADFDTMPQFERNFKKTICGNLYTPLPLNKLQNLLGASVAYGRIASKTFGNYRGGKMDPVIQDYVEKALARMM